MSRVIVFVALAQARYKQLEGSSDKLVDSLTDSVLNRTLQTLWRSPLKSTIGFRVHKLARPKFVVRYRRRFVPDDVVNEWANALNGTDLAEITRTFDAFVDKHEPAVLRKLHSCGRTLMALGDAAMTNVAAAPTAAEYAERVFDRSLEVFVTPIEANKRHTYNLYNLETLEENILTTMVRVHASGADVKRAEEYVDAFDELGLEPKVRTYTPLLETHAASGNETAAWRVWRALVARGLQPGENEYSFLLEAILNAHSSELDDATKERCFAILAEMAEAHYVVGSPSLLATLRRFFGRIGWRSEQVLVNKTGQVDACGQTLRAIDVDPASLPALRNLTRRLALEAVGRSDSAFSAFESFLHRQEPYNVWIDGANVGHYNVLHGNVGTFSFRQVDAVARRFEEQGRRVQIVLHSRWVQPHKNLTIDRKHMKYKKHPPLRHQVKMVVRTTTAQSPTDPRKDNAPAAIIADWRRRGILYEVPPGHNDDWFWLYGAVDSYLRGASNVTVISNDDMRDHHWRMVSLRAFKNWRERHQSHFHVRVDGDPLTGNLVLDMIPPPLFSRRAQSHVDHANQTDGWHFPLQKSAMAPPGTNHNAMNQLEQESTEQWLSAWRVDPAV